MSINGLGHGALIGMTTSQAKPQGQSFGGQIKAALDFVGRKLGLIKTPAEGVDRSQTPKVMPGSSKKAKITAEDRRAFRDAGQQVKKMHERQLGTSGFVGRIGQASAKQGLAMAVTARLQRGESLDSKGLAREAMQNTRELRGNLVELRRAGVKLTACRNQQTMHAVTSQFSVPLSRQRMSADSIRLLTNAALDLAKQQDTKLSPEQARTIFKELLVKHVKQHNGFN